MYIKISFIKNVFGFIYLKYEDLYYFWDGGSNNKWGVNKNLKEYIYGRKKNYIKVVLFKILILECDRNNDMNMKIVFGDI